MKRLLDIKNAKSTKGVKFGVLTGMLYLAPHKESGVLNTCASATKECSSCCLKTSGRMSFERSRTARLWKTRLLVENRELFLTYLRHDIQSLLRKAKRERMFPAVRINGTSDLGWLAEQMATEFPQVQFYDYTKNPKPWLRVRPNYHVTFSFSGLNLPLAKEALERKVNVAVVFNTKRKEALPPTWQGKPVIDGDKHDIRFIDPVGVVVGLRAKGNARTAQAGSFVVAT